MATTERISPGDIRQRAEGQRKGPQSKTAQKLAEFACFAAFYAACVSSALAQESTAPLSDTPLGTPPPLTIGSQDAPEPAGTERVDPKQESEGASEDIVETKTAEVNLNSLALADVIASVYQSYPEILQAQEEVNRTLGESTSADGFYDLKLQGYSLSEPTGFYRNYRQGIGVARQTWWGGYVSAGYRIGRGEFQPWYKERETEKAGEFKVGLLQPMLQGRGLDANRVAVFQARIAQQAALPYIQQSILDAAQNANIVYWEWVAAGAKLEAQRKLLQLAKKRGEQYEAGVKAGKFAEIDLILNQQLIAEREIKVIESEQKFQASSFKLSLYLRDAECQPMVPSPDWIPTSFPIIDRSYHMSAEQEANAAYSRRPELQLLSYQIQQIQWDQRQAQNQLLPSLDLIAEASQDLGAPASSTNDKGDFELVFGVQGEVPIQRRKARGKMQSTAAKIAQLNQKMILQQNKVKMELQIQANALELAANIVQQSEVGLLAAVDTLERYRFAFQRGKVDLIYLNLLETKRTESEIKWLDAQRNWFSTLAQLQRALALDPLEQSNLISTLSPQPTPIAEATKEQKAESSDSDESDNNAEEDPRLKAFDEDWKLHQQTDKTLQDEN